MYRKDYMLREREMKEKEASIKPSGWFFAEWISIIATFLVCFVFLFYQNQLQSKRSDEISTQFQCAMQTQSMRSDALYHQFQSAIESRNRAITTTRHAAAHHTLRL
jgi:hypothetical protein